MDSRFRGNDNKEATSIFFESFILAGESVFVFSDNAFALIFAAFGAGMVGKLGFAASRAGSHCRSVNFVVSASFIPF